MRLSRYYVIPIEFFTRERRQTVENAWKLKFLSLSTTNEFPTFFQIADDTPALYELPKEWPNGFVFFDSSGGCIVINEHSDEWTLSESNIINELADRANKHTDLIATEKQVWLSDLLSLGKSAIGKDDYPKPEINYVFGFYLIESVESLSSDDLRLIKILAEPSIAGIDDMKPCCDDKRCNLKLETKESFLDQISDCDISADSHLYVTWATMVSVLNSSRLLGETKDMLVSLEARLQLVWNRCYTISNFSDDIFCEKSRTSDIGQFYWSFTNSLDDAKSVLTSTLSSRASVVFDSLLKTSKIAGEIDRLKDKVDLLEKYLNQQREKSSIKYQRTIEALLFITALSQVVPLFFPTPIFSNQLIGVLVIATTFALGLFAILRR